ncbi:MAG: isocitrate lyase/phosphoenolpyruvate mutase family protein [Pseudomonadota bacterium]
MNPPSLSFRKLHLQSRAFVIPNPWDVGSARMFAAMGFKALATTSAGMAFAMGVPEGTVDKVQTLVHCRQLVEATHLPVAADLEKGFGDEPGVVAQTMRDAAATGLAGASIEDHTGRADDPIYEFDHAVERVSAAAEAARSLSKDFVFTARCENFLWGRPDLDDTIKRLQAFEHAGADVVYAPGIRDIDSIREICASVSIPVNVIMGIPGVELTVDDLSRAGVKRISVGSGIARAAYGALIRAAREIEEQGTFSFGQNAASFEEIEALLRK